MSPIDFFFRAARHFGDRIAIEAPEGALSYTELTRRVNAAAAALQKLDPQPGSRVGICAGNTSSHVIALLAVLAAGKVWIPLNPRSAPAELNRIIAFTRPGIVMASAKYGATLALAEVPQCIALDEPFGDTAQTLAALVDAHDGMTAERIDRADHELQAVKFTGGSTGVPKGVMQPVRAWRATVLNLIDAYRFDETTRNLLAAPITHGAGTYLLPVLAKGGCHVILAEINAHTVLEALAKRGISNVFMPPTLFYMVMEFGAGSGATFPELRHLIYGGAPMPVEKIRAAQRFFGPVVEVTYGQTEAPQIVAFLNGRELADDRYVHSVGRASLLSDFAIMGANGELLGAGETGEIVVRGQMIMSGYLDMPEKTAETIVDGWLHTGDLGYLDERGYLFLRGRSRDVIITGGFNVYPVDVEEMLGRHPDVQEVAVFGIADDKWGEAVTAAVQLRRGASADEDALVAWAKTQLGSVKTPKRIHFLDSLPRNPVGKVDKILLKSAYDAHHAAGAA
ncbi:class I adenylate-forming enzyme family protein [Burkholderia seminalis]|uniref:AMP-binding protein n=2 Tax=Burkholderia cepacia complex TaxID=87882 RepID=A0A8A8DFZ8_9BURK|nr:AMP-binding protein [Burkholderia seminalis]QTO23307.1 AMP-binding protein [Burkholderia seminalis]